MNEIAKRLIEVATAPSPAILDLVLQQAFAWMIGNGDFHAKNYSLQWRIDGLVAATPVYDIVSTIAYPLNQHMAMDMDGRDDNFTRRYFVEFGKRFDIPERLMARHLDDMTRRSEPALADISKIGHDKNTTARMDNEIRRRMDTLRE